MSTLETLRTVLCWSKGRGEEGKDSPGTCAFLEGLTSLPRVRHEAEGWREVQGVPLQFLSLLLLPLHHAHGLEENGTLHTSMPADT